MKMMAPATTAAPESARPWPRASMQNGWRLFLTLALMLVLGSGWSAVPVSGSIATDTTWAYAHSPYIVTGDLTVDSNATLTIEPGVTVYMSAGTNLTVRSGALRALGNASGWVTITSYRDFPNANPAPAPGDWGQLRMLAGTRSADTRMNHVRVRFGSGMVLEGASPSFEQIEITGHSAAAMTIDLASSPLGTGLVATGNALDAISVPAGRITGSTRWGLVGLPYVLGQGNVIIGQAPLEIDPPSQQLEIGATAQLQLETDAPAPSGGRSITLSVADASIVSAPGVLHLAEGARSGTLNVTALVPGETVLTASSAGLGSASARLRVLPPMALDLAPQSGLVLVGRELEFVVSIPGYAPAGGLEIALATTDTGVATVPARVTMAAGGRESRFRVTGRVAGETTLTATAAGYRPAQATLRVSAASLSLPSRLLVAPGLSRDLVVSLSEPAPAGGLTVRFSGGNALVSVINALTIPAGQVSGLATVSGVARSSGTVIQATADNYAAASTTVVVEDYQLGLFGLTPPLVIPQGVSWSVAAYVGGGGSPTVPIPVSATPDAPATLAANPAIATIPAGQRASNDFLRLTGVAVGATTLRLTSPGLRETALAVTVGDTGKIRFSPETLVVGQGLRVEGGLSLFSGNAPYTSPRTEALVLTSGDTTKVAVAASASSYGSPSQATFAVTGVASTAVPVSVDASSANGYQAPETKLSVTVVVPQLSFQGLDGTRFLGAARNGFRVCWHVPGAATPQQVSASDLPVELSITDQSSAGMVSGIYDQSSGGNAITQVLIRTGQYCSATVYLESPSATGSYTVTAGVSGAPASVSPAQTVKRLALRFNKTSAVLGRGLQTDETEFAVERLLDGVPYRDSAQLTVPLVSADPSRVQVPGTLTIGSGASQVSFSLAGIENTSGPVTISTGAAFPPPPEQPLSVTVVSPRLVIDGLDNSRTVLSSPDGFSVYWDVPEAEGSNSRGQRSRLATPVTLALAQTSPTDLALEFLDGYAQPITATAIASGSNRSPLVYAGSPNKAGSYRIAAQAGEVSALSETQTVIELDLGFQVASAELHQGFVASVPVTRKRDGSALRAPVATVVALTSSDPAKISVPATVTIAPGSDSVMVPILALAETSVPVTVTARAPGFADRGNVLSLTVVAAALTINGLDGLRAVRGPVDNFEVCFSLPWNGLDERLGSDTNVFVAVTDQVPAGVVEGIVDANGNPVTGLVVAAGERCATAAVGSPGQSGSYLVRASAAGLPEVASETQNALMPQINFSTDRAIVGKGLKTQGIRVERRLAGQDYAGAESTIGVGLSPAGKIAAPSVLTFEPWASSVELPLEGLDLTTVPVIVQVSSPDYDPAPFDLEVEVAAPNLRFDGLDGGRAVGAARDNFRLFWHLPGTPGGISHVLPADQVVVLALRDANPANIVDGLFGSDSGGSALATLNWPAGEALSPDVFVGTPTAMGSYAVFAELPGIGSGTSPLQVVGTPALKLLDREDGGQSLDRAVVGAGLVSQSVTLQWAVGGAGMVAPEDVTVNLACADVAICAVPPSVTLAAGEWSVVVPITGLALGSTTITLSAAGHPVVASFPVTVSAPRLLFPDWSGRFYAREVAAGGPGASFALGLGASGGNSRPQLSVSDQAITLSATLGDVSPTVTLAAGEALTWATLTSVPLWGRGTIGASAACCASATSPPFLVVPGGGEF